MNNYDFLLEYFIKIKIEKINQKLKKYVYKK